MIGDALLRDRLRPKVRGFCPHEPTERQRAFLELDCLEALYGGAAGGGKSDALLMGALQYAHVPGYAALLVRRTFADLNLPEAIMDRAKTWLMGTGAQWNANDHRWSLPCPGGGFSTLSFGYLDTEQDKYRYQSAGFHYIGCDEGTQFPESWYRYLFSRLRRPMSGPVSKVPLRMRMGSNPGGIGHKWVHRRFVDPATAEGAFVPAKLEDNPHIDQAAYRESLAKLDPTTRAQLEKGLWIQDTSGRVYSSFNRSLVVPYPVKALPWRHILAWDFGNVDAAAWGILGWELYSRVVYLLKSHKQIGLIPSECGEISHDLEREWHFDRIVGDVGGLGKGYTEEMRRRFQVPIEPAQKQNKLGYIKLFNGAMERREFLVCEGNEAFCAEAEELPWHNEACLKEAPGFDNHLMDMGLYGWRTAAAWNEEPAELPGPVPGTPAYELGQAAERKQLAIEESLRRAKREGKQLARRYR